MATLQITQLPVDEVMSTYVPGSYDQPWSWEDEERDIRERECLCCGVKGHYQAALEEHIRETDRIPDAICIGDDGRIWDGHHRLIAAKTLGIPTIPVEVF